MGRRGKRRSAGSPKPSIPDVVCPLPDGGTLTLRCVMTAKTREGHRLITTGQAGTAASSQEDAWQRSLEYLFERLATAWTVAGVEYSGQRELLMRFRAASPDEKGAVREAIRGHLAEWFPELDAP